jgi:hypothetical protein
MKNICDILNESLLDPDDLDKSYEKLAELAIAKEFHDKTKKKTYGMDMLGHEVSPGDVVISTISSKPAIGVVIEVARGCVAVCFDGDLSKMRKAADGSYITRIACTDVIKINEDIAKQIMK